MGESLSSCYVVFSGEMQKKNLFTRDMASGQTNETVVPKPS